MSYSPYYVKTYQLKILLHKYKYFYNIKFYSYLINEESEDVVGISELTITDIDTDEKFTVGKFIK